MLKPQEVSPHSFTKALFGGYNATAVDEFLEGVAEDYSALYQENAALKSKLKVMVDKVEEYRATEEAMRSALLAAQKTAESILKDAETRRDEILTNASDEALSRRDDCRREVAELEERMRRGRTEMARFVAAGRELCSQELKFLEQGGIVLRHGVQKLVHHGHIIAPEKGFRKRMGRDFLRFEHNGFVLSL